MMNKFNNGNTVLYTPNMENLPPANERLRDVGTVVSTSENYAVVYFPLSGYVSTILFSWLSNTDLPLPVNNDHNMERSLANYRREKHQNANSEDANSEDEYADMPPLISS